MAPVPPSSPTNTAMCSTSQPRTCLRSGGQEERSGGIARPPPERSASFRWQTTTTASAADRRQIRRPKTQPDLLAARGRSGAGGAAPPDAAERRVPAKVLVNVTVQRSLGPVQAVASANWSVGDLVAAAVRQYVKEGRRPPLPTADPSAFGLHYSQFSLECLNPKEKLIGLGSRTFFLCLKPAPASQTTDEAAEAATSSSTTGPCSKQAEKASEIGISWFSFLDFLL